MGARSPEYIYRPIERLENLTNFTNIPSIVLFYQIYGGEEFDPSRYVTLHRTYGDYKLAYNVWALRGESIILTDTDDYSIKIELGDVPRY
ncbi:MAG: hypothetical protein QW199_01705 [Candidatus Pacearchaeota archaeon]